MPRLLTVRNKANLINIAGHYGVSESLYCRSIAVPASVTAALCEKRMLLSFIETRRRIYPIDKLKRRRHMLWRRI